MDERMAAAGKIWECQACGKRSHDLYGDSGTSWDESCALNAVLVDCNMKAALLATTAEIRSAFVGAPRPRFVWNKGSAITTVDTDALDNRYVGPSKSIDD